VKRSARIGLVGLGLCVALALGAVYPLVQRQSAWLSAKWTQPAFLFLGLLLPFVLYRTTWGADARVPRLGYPTLMPFRTGPVGKRTRLRDLPGILRVAALAFAVLALGRPQDVLRGEESEERGIDIVVVLDLSGSMKAVMDGKPPQLPPGARLAHRATRLDTAKDVISDFVGRRKTDRIGVVVFGRSAYVLSPPILDYALVTQLVQKMELDLIDGNGTAIGDAVGVGVARLRKSDARSKAIVLLTDGDSNAGSVPPEYAAHLAQTQGVKVYTIQIGNGDEVEVQDGTDLFGQPHYVRQRFPVNPELLKKIAKDTGAESFVATDRTALEESMHAILDRLEKSRVSAQSAVMEELFPLLLLPAVVLIVLEALVRLLLIRRFP
jgi:Ca-activated chloride channel family protein